MTELGTDDPDFPHGTPRGYRRHRRLGQLAADMRSCGCAQAWSKDNLRKRRNKILSPSPQAPANAPLVEKVHRTARDYRELRWEKKPGGIHKGYWVRIRYDRDGNRVFTMREDEMP